MSDAPPNDVPKPAPPPVEPAAAKPAPAPAAAKPAAVGVAAEPKPAAAVAPKAPAPADASANPVVASLAAAVPGAVTKATEFVGEVTVELAPEKLLDACRHLRDAEKFDYLVDLFSVDWKDRAPRFDVVYLLHSFPRNNLRIRLKVKVDDASGCPTVTGLWETANWMEREVWDLMGIPFPGHPDLRRILTWDGFQGHPLRKDFPVEGIDTGAAIYPDQFPEGGGPSPSDKNRKVIG